MINTALKNKKTILLLVLITLLFGTFFFYFKVIRITPNDKIITDSNGTALFSNENPIFSVNFGDKNNRESQYIKFETEASSNNPFDNKNSKNIFTKIASIFLPKKKSSIEISLKQVNFSETSKSSNTEYDTEVRKVADILGTSEVKTSTTVADSGYDITTSKDDQKISKPTVINASVANGIDLEYQIIQGKGLKEDIIIQSLDGFSDECKTDLTKCSLPLNQYTFDLKMGEGVSVKEGWYSVDGKSTKTYYFVDSKGNYLAHFLPSYAEDNSGNKTSNVSLNIEDKGNGKYEIKVTVDSDWLLDENRVYPVRIDPSIVHDTSTDFSTGIFMSAKYLIGTELQMTDSSVLGDWSFDETSTGTCSGGGDICDRSGNNYNATISGTATSVAGVDNYARDFNGATGTHASLGDLSAFEVKSFTIEGWIRKEGTCGAFNYCTIFSKGGSGWKGYVFGLYGSSPVLDIRLDDQGANGLQVIHGTTVLSNNTWYYVAVVVDGVNKSMKLYLNGNLEASGQYSDTISYGNEVVKIGNGNDNDDLPFYGSLDDIKFSNRAKSQYEIQNSYNKYSFGVYRSPIINIGGIQNVTLSYLTSGIKTADGETPYSTTGLVAQWNFNETSGTTAVSGGSCGTSCNGTLTNFASTGSQDAAAGTGWTYNNRRWGAGALMFDGSNDYVSVPTSSALNPSGDFSIEAWIQPIAMANQGVYIKMENNTNVGYRLTLRSTGLIWCDVGTANSGTGIDTNSIVSYSVGVWQHIACVRSGSTISIYKNGILQQSASVSNSAISTTANLTIGLNTAEYFSGAVDSTRLYSRALAATEILSNYNSGVIEFQVRGGNTTNADDGSWSSWTTTANETTINSFDNSYLYSTTDTGLVAYWPMDETSGTSAADAKGSNTGTATGTTIVSGKYFNSRSFNSDSDKVVTGTNSILDTDTHTIAFWIKFNQDTDSNWRQIFAYRPSGTDRSPGIWNNPSHNCLHWRYDPGNTGVVSCGGPNGENTYFVNNQWYYIVGVKSGSAFSFYVNGQLTESGAVVATKTSGSAPIEFGAAGAGSAFVTLDEIRIFNTALSASTVSSDYIQGLSQLGVFLQKSGGIAVEGTNSNRITNSLNTGLVSYWNLNEASGTSLADSAGSNTGTATGTTVVTGKNNLARSFNGTSDYISVSSTFGIGSGNYTIEMWVNIPSTSTHGGFIKIGSTYGPSIGVGSGTTEANGNNLIMLYEDIRWIDTGVVIGTGWHHVGMVVNSSGYPLAYLDGKLIYSDITGGPNSVTGTSTTIGSGGNSARTFNGPIDEVKIFNIAKSADEILEEYNATSTYYANYNLSTTDLSTKTSVPVYIAADKPGSYISAMLGESAFANYQTDANTIGLWHLDELSGSGAYLKDSSGQNNNGTPTGTTYTSNGKISGARSFNGSSDYINAGNIGNMSSSFTVGMFIKPGGLSATSYPIDYQNGSDASSLTFRFELNTTGIIDFGAYNTSDATTKEASSTTVLSVGNWYYVVGVYNGSSLSIYINGKLEATTTTAATPVYYASNNIAIGARLIPNVSGFYNGVIDEVRVDNIARTAEQIRQAYEVGLRTHNITIQFGANLNSSNLIANSSDTSFTVDATQQGLPQMGSNLYTGDKIIVKETVSGTEYVAQGTVSAINTITGATTVLSWDTGSTFPSGGFSTKASVFKWERQYIPIAGKTISTQIDAISLLTLRITDGYGGRNVWIDDLKSNGGYINTSGTVVDLGQAYQYVQYRAIFLTADGNVTPYLNQVQVDYTQPGPTMDQIMRHGMWFDSSGVKRTFWWVGTH